MSTKIANIGKSGAFDFGFNEFVYFLKEPHFSQWGMYAFEINRIRYNCAEQWMMAEKARTFKDEETLKKILAAKHPRTQKQFGREVQNFVKEEWDAIAKDIVLLGNKAKFAQNPEAKEMYPSRSKSTRCYLGHRSHLKRSRSWN
jgi:ribA/ribD-fused uncharacterized protein